MEKEDMNNGRSETGKAKTIGRGKECSEIEMTLTLICVQVNMEV